MNDGSQASAPLFRRWMLPAVGVLLVLAGAIYFWRPRETREVPPLPANIQDAEIREYLSAVRAKTDANRGSAEAWGELGLAYLANLLDRDAAVCFAEAARLDSYDVRWPYAHAIIASKRDPANAVPLLRQAAAATRPGVKHRATARLFLAEMLLEQGQLDEAEQIFREESSNTASQPRATLGLGLVAQARGDYATAMDLLTQAREHPSSRIQATIQLAALARAKGNTEEAEALQAEANIMPDDSPWPDPMLAELARHKVGRRTQERSINELERQGNYADAARAYLRQIDGEPTADAYTGAAVNLARLQEYDMAMEYLSKAVSLDPENSRAHYTLALVSFTRAERESATNPGSKEASKWFRQAVESGKRATQVKPDHAQAYLMWGLALMHLDEAEAAITPLKKGIACRPDLFDLHLALGQAALEAGQHKDAREALENAKRLRPDDPRPQQALEDLAKSEAN